MNKEDYRRIICRFRSQEDLDKFNKANCFDITKDAKEVYVTFGGYEVKNKKPKKNPPKRDESWREHWVGLPEYETDFALSEYAKIDFYFDKECYDEKKLSEIFTQNITPKTTSVWAPEPIQRGAFKDLRVVTKEKQVPKYPVYVISKGRTTRELWHTSFSLSQCGVKHYLVVEPQEKELYEKNFGWDKNVEILELDMTFKDNYDYITNYGLKCGVGPGAARNFCMSHSKNNGFKKCWVLDDNLDCWDYRWRGRRLLTRSGIALTTLERMTDRYDNIAISSLNYTGFVVGEGYYPAFTTNTRMYSILLIDNELCPPWRGNWNEDTIISLDILSKGLCTLQMNAFNAEKLTTQKKKGGNTDEFYLEQGTTPKSQILVDTYPQYAKIKYKFHRVHHEVDYSSFTQPLHFKDGYDPKNEPTIDDMGIRIIRIPREWYNTEKDTEEYLSQHWEEFERVDNTDLWLPCGKMIAG